MIRDGVNDGYPTLRNAQQCLTITSCEELRRETAPRDKVATTSSSPSTIEQLRFLQPARTTNLGQLSDKTIPFHRGATGKGIMSYNSDIRGRRRNTSNCKPIEAICIRSVSLLRVPQAVSCARRHRLHFRNKFVYRTLDRWKTR